MIILSGASGGIGHQLVAELIEHDDVLGLYFKHPPTPPKHPKYAVAQVDITSSKSVSDFVNTWRAKLKRISLVHMAGHKKDGLFADYSEEDWDATMNINLKGNFLLTRSLLPLMVAEQWGRIIHISSVAGTEGWAGTAAYSASKTALLGLSRVLAHEYGRFNITSNVLCLGYMDAGMTGQLPEHVKTKMLSRVPSKQFGKPQEIGKAIKFLLQTDYLNGSVIDINGGL